jgi:hypothetical protein
LGAIEVHDPLGDDGKGMGLEGEELAIGHFEDVGGDVVEG